MRCTIYSNDCQKIFPASRAISVPSILKIAFRRASIRVRNRVHSRLTFRRQVRCFSALSSALTPRPLPPRSTSSSLCIYSLLLNFVGSVGQPDTTGLSSERQEELAGGSDGSAGEKYVLSLSVNFWSLHQSTPVKPERGLSSKCADSVLSSGLTPP